MEKWRNGETQNTTESSPKPQNIKNNQSKTKTKNEKEAIASIQEITPTQEPPELNEPQSDVNRDPPISFGEDQEYIPCIDDEDPWLYTFYVGEPYP